MEAVDHGRVVLGTILAYQSRAGLDHALRWLEPQHFSDAVQRNIWQIIERYLDQAGHVLTRRALEDVLHGQPPGTALMYTQAFDALTAAAAEATPAGQAEFRWSVQQLRELTAERLTGEMITRSMEILRTGVHEGREELSGHEDARTYLLRTCSDIAQRMRYAAAPEGNVAAEGSVVLEEYGERKRLVARGESGAVSTGIPELDKLIGGGVERGELDFIGGWTSAGKTSMLVQVGWHAAAVQGKNVVYLTSETLRRQIRIKLLARHSRLGQFELAHGLNSRDIKSGTLPPEGERKLSEVAADFGKIPGRLYLAQMPPGSTISMVTAQLERITRDWEADLVILDSVQLLRPENPSSRRAGWEQSSDTIKAAKEMAVTYRDGRGVPLISPWQMSKEGHRAARERGHYLIEDLSETPEVRNSADIAMSLRAPSDFGGGRDVVLDLSLLKNRDGAARVGTGSTLKLRADYATSYFVAQAGGMDGVSSLIDYQADGHGPFG
jgi:replicative DNA helicase